MKVCVTVINAPRLYLVLMEWAQGCQSTFSLSNTFCEGVKSGSGAEKIAVTQVAALGRRWGRVLVQMQTLHLDNACCWFPVNWTLGPK